MKKHAEVIRISRLNTSVIVELAAELAYIVLCNAYQAQKLRKQAEESSKEPEGATLILSYRYGLEVDISIAVANLCPLDPDFLLIFKRVLKDLADASYFKESLFGPEDADNFIRDIERKLNN